MKALSIIKAEHRNLGAVLFSMKKLVEEIEHGRQPDLKVFHGLFTYIDRFLDTFHHPKENKYLFPKLKLRHPEISKVIGELEQEHIDGEKLFVDMLKSLSAYEFAGENEFSDFRDAVYRYVDFERAHAFKEEREILPLAEEKLQASDWDEIDAAFGNNQDPLFGDTPSQNFSQLQKSIVMLVPAPFGLGKEWN